MNVTMTVDVERGRTIEAGLEEVRELIHVMHRDRPWLTVDAKMSDEEEPRIQLTGSFAALVALVAAYGWVVLPTAVTAVSENAAAT